MYVFVDTMVFLHYQDLESIDFQGVFSTEDVVIVIPRVIVRELDKHKDDHSSRRVRDRARAGLKFIESGADDNNFKDGVTLEVVLDHPNIDYQALGLSEYLNDDQFVASVFSFREKFPGNELAVISNDTGVRLKVRELGVLAQTLPEKYKLGDAIDPKDGELRRLKRELQVLKSAQPKLQLVFQCNQKEHAEFEVRKLPKVSKDEIEILLEEKRNEFPPISDPNSGLATSILATHSNEYARYQRERERYFKLYEKYAEYELEYPRILKRTIKICFELLNIGTQPAEDVDIHIHFPDGFELWEEEDFPELPAPPSTPKKPRSPYEMISDNSKMNISSLTSLQSNIHYPTSPVSVNKFSLKKSNSYDMKDHLLLLKHGRSHMFPSLRLAFIDRDAIKSFQCEYELHVANMVEPTCGKLNFVIQVIE